MDPVIVRHAESQGNAQGRWQGRQDGELTDLGRQQAATLRERFPAEGFEPTHVYASPLSRTYETARIVSTAWDQVVWLGLGCHQVEPHVDWLHESADWYRGLMAWCQGATGPT